MGGEKQCSKELASYDRLTLGLAGMGGRREES